MAKGSYHIASFPGFPFVCLIDEIEERWEDWEVAIHVCMSKGLLPSPGRSGNENMYVKTWEVWE